MMADNINRDAPAAAKKRFGCLQVFGFIVLAGAIAAAATFFILKAYLFPSQFKPVTLTPGEEKVLARKLEDLVSPGGGKGPTGLLANKKESVPGATPLEPEPYSEAGLKREVAFTERELNGLLAKNTDLADKLAIDLSDNLVSAKLLLPVDEDFPVLGGKILRVHSGAELSFKNGKPVVILKGVTVMGVPVPNAWLGGLKNIDLIERFGDQGGFWKTFSDGVEDITVSDGRLKIKLKE